MTGVSYDMFPKLPQTCPWASFNMHDGQSDWATDHRPMLSAHCRMVRRPVGLSVVLIETPPWPLELAICMNMCIIQYLVYNMPFCDKILSVFSNLCIGVSYISVIMSILFFYCSTCSLYCIDFQMWLCEETYDRLVQCFTSKESYPL